VNTVTQWITRTRMEGLVILLVAGAYIWEAHNVPDLYQMPGVPGPTTFPYILGIVFGLAGLWFLVSPGEAGPRQPAAAALGLWSRLRADWHFYAMWSVILGYLAFMPVVGFPVATFVLLAAFTSLLGEKRWWVVLGLAVGITLAIHFGFARGLNVRLPLGVLEPLLK
jgi:putative tricarboxylic transport membrane protein